MENIKNFKAGSKVDHFLFINKIQIGVTNQGKNYMTIQFRDKSGDIEAKLWEVQEKDKVQLVSGNIIKVQGDVIDYRGKLQMKIVSYRLSQEEDNVTAEQFMQVAPVSVQDMGQTLKSYMQQIDNQVLHDLTYHLIKKYQKEFFQFPAAMTNHHDFFSGLAYHSTTMLKVAEALVTIYPSLNKSLLYSAIILHDLGKVKELSGPINTTYTVEGNLLGHIVIMSDEIAQAARELNIDVEQEEVILLRHMILAHHGKLEYGSPKLPLIPEAEMIHFIDNIDARMMMFDKNLATVEPGEFSERIFPLENRSFYKSKI